MNKLVWSMAACAIALASCSQNEVTDVNVTDGSENQIALEASTGKNTRAVDANLKTLQNDANGFKVFATKKVATDNVVFIDNKAYKFVSSKWAWDLIAAELPIWPSDAVNYPVTFYAYHPADKVTAPTATSLTQAITIEPVAGQFDLLAAKTAVATMPATKRATLQFKHLFSKLGFKANVSTGVNASILSVAFKNLMETRTFDFATLSWSGAATSVKSYAYVAPNTITGNKFTDITGSSTVVSVAGDNTALMLMPQSLADAWDANGATVIADAATKAHVEMLYRLSNAAGKDEIGYATAQSHTGYKGSTLETIGYDGPLFIRVGYSIKGTSMWDMGKAYTYVIQLPGTGGVSLDDYFYDNKGNQVNLKVEFPGGGVIDPGVPPYKPGDKDYIDFTVGVDEWDNQTDTDLN